MQAAIIQYQSWSEHDEASLVLQYLAPAERKKFSLLKAGERRRAWLAARVAAKETIRNYVRQEHGYELLCQDLMIGNHPSGKPFFEISGSSLLEEFLFDLSLSHGSGVAAAVVSMGKAVGVDVEKIREFPKEMLEVFLTRQEIAWLADQKPQNQSQCATLLWCFKEAYLKAQGFGLRFHPRRLEFRWESGDSIGIFQDGFKARGYFFWQYLPGDYVMAFAQIY